MLEDLKSRMLINVLGVPGILLLSYVGRWYFLLFIIVVSLLAQNEFYILSMKKGAKPHIIPGLISGVVINFIYYVTGATGALYLTLLFILVLILLIQLFTKEDSPFLDTASTILGILYIPALLGCLILIRQFSFQAEGYSYRMGGTLLIALFVSVWVCDSLAYLFGKKWGKRKLFERRSPHKTWMGAVSGYFGALLVLLIFKWTDALGAFLYQDIIVFSLITGILGQLGDLAESMFKRDAGVKDSSHFLKGHGGVLDRFDSFFLVAPVSYIYLLLII